MQFFLGTIKEKLLLSPEVRGKSTMTSLIFSLLKNAGYRVKLVGNIGNPVLEEIDFAEESDFVVCELSSYMLERLEKQNYISVLGNIFPEHMDWHGGFEKYVKAKLNILKGSEFNIVLQKPWKNMGLQRLMRILKRIESEERPLGQTVILSMRCKNSFRLKTNSFSVSIIPKISQLRLRLRSR